MFIFLLILITMLFLKFIEITTLHSLIILAFEDTPLATTIALKFEQRGFKLCF